MKNRIFNVAIISHNGVKYESNPYIGFIKKVLDIDYNTYIVYAFVFDKYYDVVKDAVELNNDKIFICQSSNNFVVKT